VAHPKDEFDVKIDDYRGAMAHFVEATRGRAPELVGLLNGRVAASTDGQAQADALWCGVLELAAWLQQNDPDRADYDASAAPEAWWDLWYDDPASARIHRIVDLAYDHIYQEEVEEAAL
jgi:hypothetical protein